MRTQLPLDAVRDLIGLVRALYFAWRDAGVDEPRLKELIDVGKDLRAALDLAARTEPDTVGHRAAWMRAEQATAALCRMIGESEPVRPAVIAAVSRARGR